MKLCLNMIVRNEAARIERALASCAQFITCYAITDTGSNDGTPEVIKKFFDLHKIPGEISHAEFDDWSQARNIALVEARKLRAIHDYDYILLMDADMELKVHDREKFEVGRLGPSYDLWQRAGSTKYLNRRLLHHAVTCKYLGVTHEFLDTASGGVIPEEVASFYDHADGSNRPDKYKRDCRLLLEDLKKDPNNVRSMFYLANSFRDAGNPGKAALWYRRRIAAGGWDEEVWQSEVYLAHCYKDMGREGDFIRTLLDAYNRRPTRAEPMYDLAHHYRNGNKQAAALAAAEAVEHLPPSTDALFVNDFVYQAGIKEEISICGFYVPGKKDKGFEVSDKLSLQAGPYGGAREQARQNMYFYLEPLSKYCPSFEWRNMKFTPPEGWAAMNPSVTTLNGTPHANIRCVNYRIDEHGRYLIRGTDGTANDSNPITTRNFVVELDKDDWEVPVQTWEVLPPPELPCEYKLVVGFEDMRLIALDQEPWASSTVRQIHPDGNCEQVLTKLSWYDEDHLIHTDETRMLRTPRSTEKNWAPWLHDGLKFMWRPGEVVDTDGKTIEKHDTGLASDHISGSSQVISWYDGLWIAVTHEARTLPGSHLRYYYHRFALYRSNGSLVKFSRPFYFNDRTIEFCAGMDWHTNGMDLLISYGYKDAEARIAKVSARDVEDFLR